MGLSAERESLMKASSLLDGPNVRSPADLLEHERAHLSESPVASGPVVHHLRQRPHRALEASRSVFKSVMSCPTLVALMPL